MRRAMADAEVGDDVYGEDPTARRLEEVAAQAVGHEAALFVPTGTMGNQIAIHLLAASGTDVVVEDGSHVYNYELGAMAAWSGAFPRVLAAARGRPKLSEVEACLPADDDEFARASLLVLENTHNHAGGLALPLDHQRKLLDLARREGLRAHLDGARIFNASVALGCTVPELASGFDSVMFCLSKGLGAPAGSVLCGSRDLIREARTVRKRMGGGMRQIGVLAAAGLIALEEPHARLANDHRLARRLAQGISGMSSLSFDPADVESNMLIADVLPPATDRGILAALGHQGILAGTMGRGRVRFVTHSDVDEQGIDRAIQALCALRSQI
jgi:threonine aldolase